MKIRTAYYNKHEIRCEETLFKVRLLIDGREVDNLGLISMGSLIGFLPTGEMVQVTLSGMAVVKYRLTVANRIISDDW